MKLPRFVLSHVDVINDEYISGWCFNRLLPGRRATLEFCLNGQPVGRTENNLPREDVRQAGLHDSGRCGFTFRFPSTLDLGMPGDFTIASPLMGGILWRIPIAEIQAATAPSRPIFFMHIPKTAGTSFNNHVHGWFGFDRWHSHIEVLGEEQQRQLFRSPQYIAGHLPFHRLRTLVGDWSTIDLHTILREPVSQLHSHLSWIRGIGADTRSGFFEAHQPVIRELAETMQSSDLSSPRGLDRFVQRIDGFQLDFFDNIQVRYLSDHRPDRVTETDLAAALDNLERFDTIGLTECYHDYLPLVAGFYRRRHLPQKTRHNPARVAPLFDTRDPAIREILSPLFRYDRRLYDTVKERGGWAIPQGSDTTCSTV